MAIDKVTTQGLWIPQVPTKDVFWKHSVSYFQQVVSALMYAYAALPGASLQDCPWKLVSSDILVILFHCSPQTEHNVNVMAITGLSCCSHRICQ